MEIVKNQDVHSNLITRGLFRSSKARLIEACTSQNLGGRGGVAVDQHGKRDAGDRRSCRRCHHPAPLPLLLYHYRRPLCGIAPTYSLPLAWHVDDGTRQQQCNSKKVTTSGNTHYLHPCTALHRDDPAPKWEDGSPGCPYRHDSSDEGALGLSSFPCGTRQEAVTEIGREGKTESASMAGGFMCVVCISSLRPRFGPVLEIYYQKSSLATAMLLQLAHTCACRSTAPRQLP